MCEGGDCLKKESCYRYRAIPCMRQAFYTIPPNNDGKCSEYWKIEDDYRIRAIEDIKALDENE